MKNKGKMLLKLVKEKIRLRGFIKTYEIEYLGRTIGYLGSTATRYIRKKCHENGFKRGIDEHTYISNNFSYKKHDKLEEENLRLFAVK